MKKIIRLQASDKYDAKASHGNYLGHQNYFSKLLASLREAYCQKDALAHWPAARSDGHSLRRWQLLATVNRARRS